MKKIEKEKLFAGLLFDDCSIMWCDPKWHEPKTGFRYLIYREDKDKKKKYISYAIKNKVTWKDFESGEEITSVLFYSEMPNPPSHE